MGRQKDIKEKRSVVRRKVYVICEGKTELDYLGFFGSNNRDAGTFEFILKDKCSFDRNQSDRKQLVQMAEGEIRLKRTGKYTPYQYVTTVFQIMIDKGLYVSCKTYDDINKIRSIVISNLKDKPLNKDGTVCDYSLINAEIRRHVYKIGVEPDEFDCIISENPDLIHPEPDSVFTTIDRVFIVFDRDKDLYGGLGRSDSDYRAVFSQCKDLGYEVLMSTPFFEFWLWLHHRDIKVYPEMCRVDNVNAHDDVLPELKRLEQCRCSDWNCDDLSKVKNISTDRLKAFYNNDDFTIALNHSRMLPLKLEDLLDNIGTNVGVTLASLLRAESR